jgi:hypothetical protein
MNESPYEVIMGIADRLRQQDREAARAAARSTAIRRAIIGGISLAAFLFALFYFLLPMWRGTP